MAGVVLVRPNNQAVIYPELDEKGFTGIEPPLWGGILTAWLRANGEDAVLLDAQGERWDYETTAREVNVLKPELVVLLVSGTNPNASTQNMVGAEALAPLIEAPTTLHGLHPSALPQDCLQIEGVDSVIEGEGFHSITPEFIQFGLNVGGVWRKGDAFILKPPLLEGGVLPRPDWTDLDLGKYRAHLCMCFGGRPRSPYVVSYTSLGCPFKCSFCTINCLFGAERRIRCRRVEDVQREFEGYAEAGVRNIKITDEMFAFKKSRVLEVCKAIGDLKADFNMRAYARVDTVDPEMLEAMKACGINWMGYGFESGNRDVLQKAQKGDILERTYRAVRWTYEAGIHIDANYMFGMEGDDDISHAETFKLMLDLGCEWANVNTAMDLPGSEWHRRLGRGVLPYTRYAQHTPDSNPPGGEWAVRWRDWAWQAYHTNPAYLSRIETLFGLGARRQMEDLTRHRLRRDFHG